MNYPKCGQELEYLKNYSPTETLYDLETFLKKFPEYASKVAEQVFNEAVNE